MPFIILKHADSFILFAAKVTLKEMRDLDKIMHAESSLMLADSNTDDEPHNVGLHE